MLQDPLVERLTVADADPVRAGRVATAVGATCVDAPEELPAAGIDALVIAAATPAHAPLIELAAESGLPCFCEKPIALDLATTDAVLDRVRRAGILLQIGFQRRFDAGYVAAREAAASGAVGDPRLVRLAGHDPEPPPEEYVAASGGIFVDLAIHDFDIAAWVLGRPRGRGPGLRPFRARRRTEPVRGRGGAARPLRRTGGGPLAVGAAAGGGRGGRVIAARPSRSARACSGQPGDRVSFFDRVAAAGAPTLHSRG